MTASPEEHTWAARPVLATVLRVALLAVPFAASSAAIWAAARVLPAGRWWSLVLLLGLGVLVAVGVERAARRLLPIALLLRLSTVFPDRAPSRFALARAAVRRPPQHALLWTGPGAQPVSTADLVLQLVTALGTHDRRTRGHSERVRVLCDVLATELGLDADSRERLRWAALLHDVGKVEVPARILNKPGRLDAAEFDTVKLHPEAGRLLAAPLLPWLGAWADGIVDHHERWDGTGYPAGKAREEISLAGRVVGLVDAYETMTAARPYKKAMATRAAREELARCAGSHFDPYVVRAFLAVSLPRVLWAMGPLSFVLQLPFLRPIAAAGARGSSLAPQAAASLASGAAGAAGAAVLVTGGMVGGGAVPAPVPATALGVAQAPTADARPTPAPALPEAPLPVPPSTPREAPAVVLAADLSEAAPRPTPGAPAVPEPAPAPATSSGGGSTAGDEPRVDVPAAAPPLPDPVAPAEDATPAPDPVAPTPTVPTPTEPAPSPSGSPSPSPAAAAPDPVPAPSEAEATPVATAPPTTTPTASPSASAPAAPTTPPPAGPTPAPGHQVFADGPSSPWTSRDASFTLVEREGVQLECQVQGNGDGEASAWRPCAGTFSTTVLRDGDHVVRVRDAGTRNEVDSWAWTVDTAVAAQGASFVVVDLPAGPAPGTGLALLAGLLGLAVPGAATVRRLRDRFGS